MSHLDECQDFEQLFSLFQVSKRFLKGLNYLTVVLLFKIRKGEKIMYFKPSKGIRKFITVLSSLLFSSQNIRFFLDEELPIRRFPPDWDHYEEQCLLFLHFGRERLSQYLQLILASNDLDESNYYGRYEKLLKTWSAKILASKHPIEALFDTNPKTKTKELECYLVEWKNYVSCQVISLKMELYLIKVLLVSKMARYPPKPALFVPPD